MLNLLNDYVATLNTEIASYETLIAKKRVELEQLTQIQAQVVEALGVLKEVVTNLKDRDPNAIAVIKEAAHRIFENTPSGAVESNVTESREPAPPSDTEDTSQLAQCDTTSPEAPLPDTEATVEPETEGDEQEYDADMVRIVTERFNGAFNGIVGKVTNPSNFGTHVQLSSNEEKFFLESELEESFDEIPF
jgi:hypothetical protein